MRFYGDIARIDEEQRMVWGYAGTEARALDGQIITREAMTDALDDYMAFANIREMHQPSAVGIAREASTDDKGLYIGAHIVDDTAWDKVKRGVYKGFSIGGKATKRDDADRTIIRGIKILEISLVDRPSDPGSVFDVYRSAAMQDEPDEDLLDMHTDDLVRMASYQDTDLRAAVSMEIMRRSFTAEQRQEMAGKGEALKDGSFPIANRSDLENAIRAFGRAKDKRAAKRHIIKRAKALGATDLIPADWTNDTKRAAGAQDGDEDMATRTDGEQDIERGAGGEVDDTTVLAEGGEEGSATTAEGGEEGGEGATGGEAGSEGGVAQIDPVARAAEATARGQAALDALERAAAGEDSVQRLDLPGADIRRGMGTVARLSYLLSELAYFCQDAQWESDIEGDNSPVPGKLRASLIELARAFQAMSAEEVSELLSGVGVDVSLENGVIAFMAAGADIERAAGLTVSDDLRGRLSGAVDTLVQRGWYALPAPAADPAQTDEITRLAQQNDELQRSVGTLAETTEKLSARIEELAKQPLPAKTAASAHADISRAVSKEDDARGAGGPASEPQVDPLRDPDAIKRAIDAMSPTDRALLLTRAALAAPQPVHHS